jgi:hypothetical protein
MRRLSCVSAIIANQIADDHFGSLHWSTELMRNAIQRKLYFNAMKIVSDF